MANAIIEQCSDYIVALKTKGVQKGKIIIMRFPSKKIFKKRFNEINASVFEIIEEGISKKRGLKLFLREQTALFNSYFDSQPDDIHPLDVLQMKYMVQSEFVNNDCSNEGLLEVLDENVQKIINNFYENSFDSFIGCKAVIEIILEILSNKIKK
jgi:hypothetical protein